MNPDVFQMPTQLICRLLLTCSLPYKSDQLPDNVLTRESVKLLDHAKYANNAEYENRVNKNSLVTKHKELRTVRISFYL